MRLLKLLYARCVIRLALYCVIAGTRLIHASAALGTIAGDLINKDECAHG
jgi:hypothetical protein